MPVSLYFSGICPQHSINIIKRPAQPQLAQHMECLLQEINAQEESRIQFTRSSYQGYHNQKSSTPYKAHTANKKPSTPSTDRKSCIMCKTAGRQYLGHLISSCWFISKVYKLEISKTFHVNTFMMMGTHL